MFLWLLIKRWGIKQAAQNKNRKKAKTMSIQNTIKQNKKKDKIENKTNTKSNQNKTI